MTPETRKKITDAFNAAVNASPYADEAIEGLANMQGQPLTRRQLVGSLLQDDQFFEQVDKMLGAGKVTLDQFIGKFEDGMKKSNRGPKA